MDSSEKSVGSNRTHGDFGLLGLDGYGVRIQAFDQAKHPSALLIADEVHLVQHNNWHEHTKQKSAGLKFKLTEV